MNGDDFEGEYYDRALDDFPTYEDYLDHLIGPNEKMYLEDIELARQLIALAIHTKNEVLSREQFKKKKEAIEESKKNQNKEKIKMNSHKQVENQDLYKKDEFLNALAEREDDVLNGRLMTIIFLRAEVQRTKDGPVSEISGYIDYAHRLKVDDFRQYFAREKILIPRSNDLSYYNWTTQKCFSADSPNFKVDASATNEGLLFRNKRDRKVINVGDKGDTKRIELKSPLYKQIVLYDHWTRKKAAVT